jgi:putative transposase
MSGCCFLAHERRVERESRNDLSSYADRMTSQMLADALTMAVSRRETPVYLRQHSNQECQNTSGHFQLLLREQGAICR